MGMGTYEIRCYCYYSPTRWTSSIIKVGMDCILKGNYAHRLPMQERNDFKLCSCMFLSYMNLCPCHVHSHDITVVVCVYSNMH